MLPRITKCWAISLVGVDLVYDKIILEYIYLRMQFFSQFWHNGDDIRRRATTHVGGLVRRHFTRPPKPKLWSSLKKKTYTWRLFSSVLCSCWSLWQYDLLHLLINDHMFQILNKLFSNFAMKLSLKKLPTRKAISNYELTHYVYHV